MARVKWVPVEVLLILTCLVVSPFAFTRGSEEPMTSLPHEQIRIEGDEGFTVENGVTSGTGTSMDPYILEGWEIRLPTISDVDVPPVVIGIEIRETSAFFVIRNVFVHSGGVNSIAILLEDVENGYIENSTILNSYQGLAVRSSSGISISGNSFSSLPFGVFLRLSTDIDISANDLSNSGIIVEESSGVTISDNKLSNGPHTDSKNLCGAPPLYSCDGNIATNRSSDISILRNTVVGNFGGHGIWLDQVFPVNVYHNDLINNTVQARDGQASYRWDFGYPDGGNYWSDYVGKDECNGPNQDICTGPDGMGDLPYVIDAGSLDKYPLMVPYGLPFETQPPTWPAGSFLNIYQVDSTSVNLVWTRAGDETAVVRYGIYQGGTLISIIAGDTTAYTITNLTPGEAYNFKVEAKDPWNNWSSDGPSGQVTVEVPKTPFLKQYFYLILVAVAATVAVPIVVWRALTARKPAVQDHSSKAANSELDLLA